MDNSLICKSKFCFTRETINYFKKLTTIGYTPNKNGSITQKEIAGKLIVKNQEKRPLDNISIKNCLLNAMNVIAHPSVLFKKSIFLRTGFYSDLYPFAEDYELWLKSIKFFNFSNLPDILVDYTLTHNPKYSPEIHKIVCLNYNILYNKIEKYDYIHKLRKSR